MTALYLCRAVSFSNALTHRATCMPQKLIITAFDPPLVFASHLPVMTVSRNLARCVSDWSGTDTWGHSEPLGLILFPKAPNKQWNWRGHAIICECIESWCSPPRKVLHSSFNILAAIKSKKNRSHMRVGVSVMERREQHNIFWRFAVLYLSYLLYIRLKEISFKHVAQRLVWRQVWSRSALTGPHV